MIRLLTIIAALSISLIAVTVCAENELTVKPYGFVLFNTQYNENVKADIPTTVAMTDTTKNVLMTARQTRLGLNFGMEELGWKIGAKTEVDFWGLRGSGKNGSSMQSAPRLRLAFFTLTKNSVTFLFGQDWVILAPLSPETDAHVSIPGFSSSGNLWNRMPQIRFEYKRVTGERTVLLQLAAVRPLASDRASDSSYSQADLLGAGELNGLPFAQGRFAFSPNAKFTIGVSGHIGQEDFGMIANDTSITDKTSTYAVALDFKAGNPNVTFMGEGYIGSNLTSFFSNGTWFTGAWIDSSKCGKEPVKSVGGWASIGIKPPNGKVMFNVGVGMEKLNEEQVDSVATHDADKVKLTQNLTAFGNVLYSVTSKVRLGIEIGYIKTDYTKWDTTPTTPRMVDDNASNVSANFSAKFSF